MTARFFNCAIVSCLTVGATLLLDSLQLVLSELGITLTAGSAANTTALSPVELLGASTFGSAIRANTGAMLALTDVDMVLPSAQLTSYLESICLAEEWAYTETLQARSGNPVDGRWMQCNNSQQSSGDKPRWSRHAGSYTCMFATDPLLANSLLPMAQRVGEGWLPLR